MARKRMSLEERFWKEAKPGDKDSCWEWMGAKTPAGYGHINWNSTHYYTHRLSWMIHNGKIPKGMEVCHHCDNPGCVNPAHLFLGTHRDNMRDRDKKKRGIFSNPKFKGIIVHVRGEKSPVAKLTDRQVKEIRMLYARGGWSYPKLAKRYKVSEQTIYRLITLKSRA